MVRRFRIPIDLGKATKLIQTKWFPKKVEGESERSSLSSLCQVLEGTNIWNQWGPFTNLTKLPQALQSRSDRSRTLASTENWKTKKGEASSHPNRNNPELENSVHSLHMAVDRRGFKTLRSYGTLSISIILATSTGPKSSAFPGFWWFSNKS